jgi:hypothetical protein
VLSGQIRATLVNRFGSGYHSPHGHGKIIRAACLALGIDELPEDDFVSWRFWEPEDFLAEVERLLRTV